MNQQAPRPVPPQLNIAMQSCAGFNFNFASLIAIDFSGYVPGAPGRAAVLYLLGPTTHRFEEKRADEFYMWFLNMTGQTVIQEPNGAVPAGPGRIPMS